MKVKVVKTPKGTIEYSSCGEGTPVLFVHGGHGNSKELSLQIRFDLKKYHLITPSRPGYGQTPLLNDSSPFATADLLVSLLDELQIQRVMLIGISAGGPVSLELASSFPERVSKLILISAVTQQWLREEDPVYRKGKKLFKPSVEKYSWALFKFFYAFFPRSMAKILFKELSMVKGEKITKEEIKEVRAMVQQQRSNNGFVHDLDQFIKPDVLVNISSPTLIIHSQNDNSVDIDHAYFASSRIKGSILKTYSNKWGHLVWIGEGSGKIIREILQFIEQQTNEEF